MEPISKDKIDHLILNYFIQEGHQAAAISFAKELNIELNDNHRTQPKPSEKNAFVNQLNNTSSSTADGFSKLVSTYLKDSSKSQTDVPCVAKPDVNSRISAGYSTIRKRREIKYLILKGHITDAILRISECFPTILDSNNLLHFKLLRLNLIEMIRNHKLQSSIDNEKVFLNDILKFVRENLVNKVTNSFKLLKELEITMSLLCFNFDPSVKNIEEQKDLPEELRSLFNLSLRNQCYRVVNRAILDLDANNTNLSLEDNNYGAGERESGRDYNGPKYMDFDLSNIDKIEADKSNDDEFEFEKGMEDVDMKDDDEDDDEEEEDYDYNYEEEYVKNVSSITGRIQTEDTVIQNEELEDELNKLQNISLESKLERIIKLWVITLQRIIDIESGSA